MSRSEARAGGGVPVDGGAVGDGASGDSASGDSASGDSTSGDSTLGDSTLGDSALGDSALGDWEQDVASLAGSLVHEVKNPLSTLNISTQLLLEELGDPSSPRDQRIVKRLRVMGAEIGRIEQIISSFLQFVRLQTIDGRPLDVSALLRRLLSDNADGLERAGIRAHYQPAEDIPELLGDENLLRQAFLNLLRNAEQAMPEGGELIVRVARVERGEAGPRVEIEFTDTGVGIPPEQCEKIFRPYVSSKREGTGLGLPTVLRIVRLHGGTIRVDSEPGRGSRFFVELPIPGKGDPPEEADR